MRKRLKHLGDWFSEQIAPHGFRVFSDSAPILEKHLAEKAGLGWIGKHTLLLSRSAGSWFFWESYLLIIHYLSQLKQRIHDVAHVLHVLISALQMRSKRL